MTTIRLVCPACGMHNIEFYGYIDMVETFKCQECQEKFNKQDSDWESD